MPRKADHNQKLIVQALRDKGVHVFSLHMVGQGCPDLLCSFRERWYLIEVKNGELGWKLTDAQKKFRALAKADVGILTCVEDAELWVKRLADLENRNVA